MALKKTKVHYAVSHWCATFIPACTLKSSYECGLFEALWTTEESQVTCKRCLDRLAEFKEHPKDCACSVESL